MRPEREAINVLNSMHVSWIYLNPALRKQYDLEKDIAYYHADSNIDEITRIEKEFNKLNLIAEKDYYVQDTTFDDGHIYTICLKEAASKKLENMGIKLISSQDLGSG